MYEPPLGRFTSVDPVTASQESLSTYQYGWNNPVLRSDRNGNCPECPPGNGMSIVENVYWSTRDAIVSSAVTIATSIGSLFGSTKPQRVNAEYGSAGRTLSKQDIPQSELAGEIVGSVLTLASSVPSGNNAGSGLFMAKSGTKASMTTSMVDVAKEGLNGAKSAQKAVLKGQAPGGVERIDIPKLDPNGNPMHGQKSHAHVKIGKKQAAINQDGSYKHGDVSLTDKVQNFLKKYGWNL
jgi:uncharacterized protein RhaS with RHS repeats